MLRNRMCNTQVIPMWGCEDCVPAHAHALITLVLMCCHWRQWSLGANPISRVSHELIALICCFTSAHCAYKRFDSVYQTQLSLQDKQNRRTIAIGTVMMNEAFIQIGFSGEAARMLADPSREELDITTLQCFDNKDVRTFMCYIVQEKVMIQDIHCSN
jgi:hypothetical protein